MQMMNNQAIRMAYNFVQLNEEETEIEIYDIISSKKSYDWWTDTEGTEVTPNDFKEKMKAVNTNNVTIRMNSAGGEVNAATVIAVAIQEARQSGKTVKCKIDGLCASAAVQIAISCDEIIMHSSALMMIHNPMMGMCGYFDELELNKIINGLGATKNAIINFYEEKTGMTRQKLSNMMDAETWMTGKEAVDKGFADKLMFDGVEEGEVMNRIHAACINTAIKLPEDYQAVMNKLPKEKGVEDMEAINTAQELMAKYPELTEQIRNEAINTAKNEGIEAGIKQERERLQAIDELGEKVSAELLNKAKYETFDTAANVAVEAIKTGAFVHTGVINAMQTETQAAQNVAGVTNGGNAENPVDDKTAVRNKAQEIAAKHFKSMGKE